MSVPNNLRNLSKMEFYKGAIKIRAELSSWMMRDFGNKYSKKSVSQVIKNISQEDQNTIDEIFQKYDKIPNQEFQCGYPSWFVDFERNVLMDLVYELVSNITTANSIYAIYIAEFDLRRKYQNLAICDCYKIFQELQYIASIFPNNLNYMVSLLDLVEEEVGYLKSWRQSDNKSRKKALEKELKEQDSLKDKK